MELTLALTEKSCLHFIDLSTSVIGVLRILKSFQLSFLRFYFSFKFKIRTVQTSLFDKILILELFKKNAVTGMQKNRN